MNNFGKLYLSQFEIELNNMIWNQVIIIDLKFYLNIKIQISLKNKYLNWIKVFDSKIGWKKFIINSIRKYKLGI